MRSGDPDRLSTWVRFRRGLCETCSAGCCRLPLEVSVFDLVRLGWIDSNEAQLSIKKIAQKLKTEKKIKRVQNKTQLFLVDQKANGDCILLDSKTRLCTVYKKRPEVCREFPNIGPKPGSCPYQKKQIG